MRMYHQIYLDTKNCELEEAGKLDTLIREIITFLTRRTDLKLASMTVVKEQMRFLYYLVDKNEYTVEVKTNNPQWPTFIQISMDLHARELVDIWNGLTDLICMWRDKYGINKGE